MKKTNFVDVLGKIFGTLRKENVIEVLVQFGFYILLFVFLKMNVTFYTDSCRTFDEKITLGAAIAVIEIIAVWLLFQIIKIKVNINEPLWGLNVVKIVFLLILYLGLSIPSISSRVGYIINAVKEQNKIVNISNKNSDQNDLDVESIDNQINILKDKIKHANKNLYLTNQQMIDNYKLNRSLEIDKLVKDRKKYSTSTNIQEYNSTSAEDAYTTMGRPFSINGTAMFTILLVMRLFFLDICIILVVFLGKRKDKTNAIIENRDTDDSRFADYIRSNRDTLLKYVDCLLEEEDNKEKLRKDIEISEKTGIPLKICFKYKELLKTKIKYGKVPAIVSGRGSGTKANFYKKDIKQIILSYANLY